MPGVYSRVAKITNAAGRSGYLGDEKRQEEIVLQKSEMRYSWQQHADFERTHQKTDVANHEALEVHIALPNQLSQNPEKLERVCDDLVEQIVGKNHDYEYAVHWNHSRTNLHVHILFSERENQLEIEPKTYKKDIWHDKDTHKLAKAGAENAVLIHRKGDIQRNKDGSVKYKSEILQPKDTKFKTRKWMHDKNESIQSILKRYGYDLEITKSDSPYLAQKKLYKNARSDYLEKAKAWNAEVKRYNDGVRQHIELEPEQRENYVSIKREVLVNVKEANAEERKITPEAVSLVQDMATWVHKTLLKLKRYINEKSKESEVLKRWEESKTKFSNLFRRSRDLRSETEAVKDKIDNFEQAKKHFADVIDSKLELIEEMQAEITQLKSLESRAYRGWSEEDYEEAIEGLDISERIEQAKEVLDRKERWYDDYER